VLAPGQIRMEAGGQFDEGADPAANLGSAERWLENPREQLERRRLAGAVSPDDPQRLAIVHVERDVSQRPEFLALERVGVRLPKQGRRHRRQQVAKAVVRLPAPELFPDAVEGNPRLRHQTLSANLNSAWWKISHA